MSCGRSKSPEKQPFPVVKSPGLIQFARRQPASLQDERIRVSTCFVCCLIFCGRAFALRHKIKSTFRNSLSVYFLCRLKGNEFYLFFHWSMISLDMVVKFNLDLNFNCPLYIVRLPCIDAVIHI